jgi:hypothetical protein
MGLRTHEGVAMTDLAPLAIPPARFDALAGFLEIRDDRLAATASGRPVLDHLIATLASASASP